MNNKQKTFVLLTPAFPADESDSVWVPAVQLFARKLKENFPDLSIVVLPFKYPHHTETYTWHGVQVTGFNGLHARRFSRLLLWWKVWKRLRKIKRQQEITGLFSFWCGECALVGKYFGRRYGIKHYCWISGMDAKKDNKLIRLIRPRSEELIAMSVFLAEEFNRNHSVKPAHLIPPGIDPSEYLPYAGERDIDILGAGSLIPAKQYDVFIHIVKQLSNTFPGIKAVICGDGEDRSKLQELIRELHLEDNITLEGVRRHSEVLQWMQRSKIFLHPSLYEGFGLVYIEALYAGAHAIGFTYPLDYPVPNWHVVNDPAEMIAKAAEILKGPRAGYSPVLVQSMDKSVKAVMKLFDREPGVASGPPKQ